MLAIQMGKLRADELLASKGLCESRTKAKAVIMAGKVWIGTERVDKPGRMLSTDADLRVEQPPPYVGRGGFKLAAFLGRFEISTENSDSLDLGSSTGGFTDCLLQSGARSVTCVDVGRGQLHGKLRKDGRVHVREGLNARHLESDDLPLLAYDLVTLDLSFISLRKVLQRAWSFLRPGGKLIALVKPQFEATKEEADAGRGIIRNPEIHDRVVQGISSFAEKELEGSLFIGCVESPLRGAEGNIEFLLGWEKGASEG